MVVWSCPLLKANMKSFLHRKPLQRGMYNFIEQILCVNKEVKLYKHTSANQMSLTINARRH